MGGLDPAEGLPFEDSPAPDLFTSIFRQLWGVIGGGSGGEGEEEKVNDPNKSGEGEDVEGEEVKGEDVEGEEEEMHEEMHEAYNRTENLTRPQHKPERIMKKSTNGHLCKEKATKNADCSNQR